MPPARRTVMPPGFCRRVPPAIFAPLLGTLGVALAWRGAARHFGLSSAIPELLAGFGIALALLAYGAYGCKLAQRPGVLREELRILPGRAGTGAALVGLYAAAQLIAPYAPMLARGLLIAAMAAHVVFWAVLIPVMKNTPGQGHVTPVWQLNFVGPIVAAQAAAGFGWTTLASGLWVPMALIASFVWLASLRQAMRQWPPAPLRPVLMIHLAPVAMLGNVAAALGWGQIALGFASLSVLVLILVVVRLRWLTEAGFSPLWGAFTFPLAATSGLWVAASGMVDLWSIPARILVVVATLVTVTILLRVWRGWADGTLARKSNAATA